MTPRDEFESSRMVYYIVLAVVLIALLVVNYMSFRKHVSSNSQSINDFSKPKEHVERAPAVAGLFYSEDKVRLDSDVEHYLSVDFNTAKHQPQIIIVPHAGYEYSAQTAAKAYARLKDYKDQIKRVVLVGPSHQVAFKGLATTSKDFFTTPLGKVKVSKSFVKDITQNNQAIIFDAAHEREHSLEVQLPFLQKTLGNFSILPLVYGEIDPAQLADTLAPYVARNDTLIVVSADLSHYMTYEEAQAKDQATAKLIAKTNPDLDPHMSCGSAGINAALILARVASLHPELLDLINSGDVKGNHKNVVGYGAWMFTPNNKEEDEELTPIEQEAKNLEDFVALHGKDLLRLAEQSLIEAVTNHKLFSPSRGDYEDVLFNKGASFVTLEKNGELRGCIGTVVPSIAIAHDVAKNAYQAALEDQRFSPITEDELQDIAVSISLLTDYERIRFTDEDNLLSQITPGTDGLILRDGNRQGLFLPQVWDKIPDKKEFLSQLKIKAGLAPSYQSPNMKIYKFRTVGIK